VQFDEEEGKERLKEEIGDRQEVTVPDLCGVITHKGCPCLSCWLVCANLPHVLLDGSLADMNIQFQQFPTNTLSSEDADCSSPSL
jgi:hypothetical protein